MLYEVAMRISNYFLILHNDLIYFYFADFMHCCFTCDLHILSNIYLVILNIVYRNDELNTLKCDFNVHICLSFKILL